MYKIVKDNEPMATVSALSYVRLQPNGCFALCKEETASGIVIDGTVYHIDGKAEIPDVETVVITEISEVAYQQEQKAAQEAAQLETQVALAELTILIAGGTMAE